MTLSDAAIEARRQQAAERSAARLEDLEWMAATGESLTGAARRLGITPTAVERFLHRTHRPDLATQLRRRDPERTHAA